MTSKFSRFLILLEQWPINKIKTRRDLGDHLRKEFSAAERAGNEHNVDNTYLDQQYNALDRIVNNVHAEKYKRQRYQSSASGFSLEICNLVASKDFDLAEYFGLKRKR